MHRVNEIMSQDVVHIAPTDSIRHAAQLMEHYDVGALPVCDNNRLIGMVTDPRGARDFGRQAAGDAHSRSRVGTDRMVFRRRFAGRDPALHGGRATAPPAGRRSRQRLVGMLSLADIATRMAGPERDDLANTLEGVSQPKQT